MLLIAQFGQLSRFRSISIDFTTQLRTDHFEVSYFRLIFFFALWSFILEPFGMGKKTFLAQTVFQQKSQDFYFTVQVAFSVVASVAMSRVSWQG